MTAKVSTRNCEFCGTEMLKPRPKQKFCSCKCTHGRRAQESLVTGNCKRCGDEFTRSKSKMGFYCKKACLILDLAEAKKAAAKPKVEGNCKVCGDKFIGTRPEQKYCSNKCATSVTALQMGSENRKHTKEKPCATCGVTVTVLRNVPDCKVHCEEHRSFYKKPKPRNCKECGESFLAIRPSHFWCSIKCASVPAAKLRSTETKIVACNACGDDITVPKSTDQNRVMCEGCRKASKREINARWSAEQQEKKKVEMITRLQSVIDQHGPEAPEVTAEILALTPRNAYHRPMLEAIVAKALEAKVEAQRQVEKNIERDKRVAAFRPLLRRLVGARCAAPHDCFAVAVIDFDAQEETWILTMGYWDGKEGSRKMPLAKYLLEAKLGRLLRDDEIITWVNGNKDDCSLDNLQITTVVDPIEYRGFWTASKRKVA